MKRSLLILILILFLSASLFAQEKPTQEKSAAEKPAQEEPAPAKPELTLHEWGTITTIHHPNGEAFGHLNRTSPDAVLPSFVHRLEDEYLKPFRKGPNEKGHKTVKMRLETPMIYFYPSKSFDLNQKLYFNVSFKGGLIDEYYPNARPHFHNLHIDIKGKTRLADDTVGGIYWMNIKLGSQLPVPETDSNVWLAPRSVDAAQIETLEGETEKYLSYRGIGNLPALLGTQSQTEDNNLGELQILNPTSLPLLDDNKKLTIPTVWAVSIRKDGTGAFQQLGPLTLTDKSGEVLATVSMDFADKEYTTENLIKLQKSMKEALVQEGLFEKEVEAILKTCEQSYFHQAGNRIFYIVPKAWVETNLPLVISVPANTVRVFVGRIDIDPDWLPDG